jgi:AcrR family transcriptional regulator
VALDTSSFAGFLERWTWVKSPAMSSDNRAKILDLAVAAIDLGGEEAIRVHHLVAEAGVTVPVPYHYFGSRDGLVNAAQVARYTRRTFDDIARIGKAVDKCTSKDELRDVLVTTWTRSLARRAENRWVRTSALGSAYARPELKAAIAKAQDDVVAQLCEFLEPCRERGWLRPGIDLTSTVAWHHSLLIGRVHIELGQKLVDPVEWDRLTIEVFDHAFFG